MQRYAEYSIRLEEFIKDVIRSTRGKVLEQDALVSALNGDASAELRRLIDLDTLRKAGAFFTPKDLAVLALAPVRQSITRESIVADFACGTGDLLIAGMQESMPNNSVSELLASWGRQLIGNDIHSEFISVAKRRLLLLALLKASSCDVTEHLDIDRLFPLLEVRNGLSNTQMVNRATHIILNPPFYRVQAPPNCSWGSGKVNQAAVFMETCVMHSAPGTRIVAILPDVLRSGTLYRKWRNMIASSTVELRSELYGQFDRWTDVHVFVLDLLVQPEIGSSLSMRWNSIPIRDIHTVAKWFEVNVGAVVDFRDPRVGSSHPYLTSKRLPAWTTITSVSQTREYVGRLFEPPFVAVRRTSRQEDSYRAIGTIVATDTPVAVDNHLLILTPHDRSIKRCEQLLRILQKPETSAWLNQRIRCRHLTVASLKQLPWWETDNG